MSLQHTDGSATLTGGRYADHEHITRAHVDILGVSPNATCKLYQWEGGSNPDNPGSWREVDRLTATTITEAGNGLIHFDGTSDQLVNEVRLTGADATVRWTIKPRGCKTCG